MDSELGKKVKQICGKLVQTEQIEFHSIDQPVLIPQNVSFYKKLFAFVGPALFVSIGYLDPGNWATDLAAGSQFGYKLVWVLFLSNIMALTLQILTTRLALVTRMDLAKICKTEYPRSICIMLWIIMEIAVIATDLAEVIGTAVGLQLLIKLPLLAGVIITALDTLLFLLIQKYGIRKLEIFILVLLGMIGLCFVIELFIIAPPGVAVMKGFIPSIDGNSINAAIGILGATVMPHNFFLHSGLVQSRSFENTHQNLRQAFFYNVIDTMLSLNFAFFVNVSILIVSGAVFYSRNIVISDLSTAYNLLSDLMNSKLASVVFGLGLFCAGQSSTITGTMAGQIIMEGFLELSLVPWVQRLVTRLLAIVPAVIVILITGSSGIYELLIYSQVILSFALPFAVIPILRFTANKRIMGPFVNHPVLTVIASLMALFIVVLNVWGIVQLFQQLIQSGKGGEAFAFVFLAPVSLILLGLLFWITFLWKPKIINLSEEVEMDPQQLQKETTTTTTPTTDQQQNPPIIITSSSSSILHPEREQEEPKLERERERERDEREQEHQYQHQPTDIIEVILTNG